MSRWSLEVLATMLRFSRSKSGLFGWHCLSNATCLMPHLFSTVLLVLHGELKLLHHSPDLKKACVRQAALDKRFPLIPAAKIPRGAADREVEYYNMLYYTIVCYAILQYTIKQHILYCTILYYTIL